MAQSKLPLRSKKKPIKAAKKRQKPKSKPGKVSVRAHYRSKPKG